MIEPILYMQTDPKWANIRYATGNNDKVGREIANIGNSGCGPSCMAMVISTLTGQEITPENTCAWSLAHGYKATNQGTYYSYFEPQGEVYGISVKQMNTSNNYHATNQYYLRTKVLTELHDGNWIIACMGSSIWTTSGHFVLAYYKDNDDDMVYIKDSYNTNKNCSKAHKDTFCNAAKYFWLVDVKGYLAKHGSDDEVIESKLINIFGDDYSADTIVKEERNFMSPRVFENAGFEVTNEGAKPIIKMPGVKVNGKNYEGFSHNGKTYISLEDYEKSLGSDVGWNGESVLVVR